MLEHVSNCTGGLVSDKSFSSPLDLEMHCLCGFSSSDGNALARHLVTCERRTAYPSVEAVQENTVKRNMLDMLGLVRRADENEDNTSKTPPPPTTEEVDTPASPAPPVHQDESINNEMDTSAAEISTDQPLEQEYEEMEQSEPVDQPQFNTELSLDDLGPPSVLQPASTEPDRTPQLKEYQVCFYKTFFLREIIINFLYLI